MITEKIFNGNGSNKYFTIDIEIPSENHINVFVGGTLKNVDTYEIINNAVVFDDDNIPTIGTGNVIIKVATNASELTDDPTDTSIVASNISDVNLVADHIDGTISTNIPDALTHAQTASTKANEASTSATSASTSASTASTKANEASTSATSASDSATTATLQAGIATTKATNASTSASEASTSATASATSATDSANSATASASSATNASASATSASNSATSASTSATNSQLRAWEAEAKKMTADSYATEVEDVFVKTYTSNGDGTFTATDTTEYSALHYKNKAEGIVTDGIGTENVLNSHIIGTSNVTRLDDLVNISHSAGIVSGCALTDNGNGTINIASGEALLRDTASEQANVFSVGVVAQTNIALTDNATNYVRYKYNGGSPVFDVVLNITDVNCLDNCLAYVVHRRGTNLDYISSIGNNTNFVTKGRRLFLNFGRFIHSEGGTAISEPSPLALGVTAGSFNFMVTNLPHNAFDTSIAGTANENVFTLMYKDGSGGWTSVADQKLINTTQYDDGTGTLATIGNSKYGVSWIYMLHNTPSRLIVLPSQQDYANQAEADNASTLSDIPEELEGLGSLIGYVTYKEDDTTFTNILSSFTQTFSSSQATNHNNLAGIQGGGANDYQHMTTAQVNKLESLPEVASQVVGKSAMLKGAFSLSNTTLQAGMATKLYTGNGGTQSIDAGVDLATQWGDSTEETYGGLVWIKNRSSAYNHVLQDSIREATVSTYDYLHTNLTAGNGYQSDNDGITSFTTSGFNLGYTNSTSWNASGSTYSSWIFQTTHRISGTTNHGKTYTCHYNPITGFTMVKYEGSGIAGHEIPHHLGRELGLVHIKNISAGGNWYSQYRNNYALNLNGTGGEGTTNEAFSDMTLNNIVFNASTITNVSGQNVVIYGWANSYYDDNGVLNGNYEIGTYQGTGASSNKITTRGKPAWVMIKSISDAGTSWIIFDNIREDSATERNILLANTSSAEDNIVSDLYNIDFLEDGFAPRYSGADDEINTPGEQYLYMVVYDNDSGSGKSKYDMPSESTNINTSNLVLAYSDGVDSNGSKSSIENVGSVTLAGINWDN